MSQFYLGIDLGSVSLKVALLGADNEVFFSRWVRVAGRPTGLACQKKSFARPF